jgi:hypothetical protein
MGLILVFRQDRGGPLATWTQLSQLFLILILTGDSTQHGPLVGTPASPRDYSGTV